MPSRKRCETGRAMALPGSAWGRSTEMDACVKGGS